MSTLMTTLLFAYGTLSPADPEAAARLGWTSDMIRGRLFDLGPYPTVADLNDPEADWVAGSVRALEPGELARLDEYEGVAEGFYRRESTITQAGREVWVYLYAKPLPPEARGPIDRWDGPRVDFARSRPDDPYRS
jgi:gamma-glutamylcyclotransferase (GGCT)/AIG2-like uncharacterized protein YtfP